MILSEISCLHTGKQPPPGPWADAGASRVVTAARSAAIPANFIIIIIMRKECHREAEVYVTRCVAVMVALLIDASFILLPDDLEGEGIVHQWPNHIDLSPQGRGRV